MSDLSAPTNACADSLKEISLYADILLVVLFSRENSNTVANIFPGVCKQIILMYYHMKGSKTTLILSEAYVRGFSSAANLKDEVI